MQKEKIVENLYKKLYYSIQDVFKHVYHLSLGV